MDILTEMIKSVWEALSMIFNWMFKPENRWIAICTFLPLALTILSFIIRKIKK